MFEIDLFLHDYFSSENFHDGEPCMIIEYLRFPSGAIFIHPQCLRCRSFKRNNNLKINYVWITVELKLDYLHFRNRVIKYWVLAIICCWLFLRSSRKSYDWHNGCKFCWKSDKKFSEITKLVGWVFLQLDIHFHIFWIFAWRHRDVDRERIMRRQSSDIQVNTV